jgi:hypothetical protein
MGHSAAPRDSLNGGTAVVTASVSSRPATECERVFAASTLTRFGAVRTVPVMVRWRHSPVVPIAPSSRIAMALASDMTRRDRGHVVFGGVAGRGERDHEQGWTGADVCCGAWRAMAL